MKKNILIAAFLAFGFAAQSQITIDKADFAVAGDWFLTADDTLISLTHSADLKVAGANKTWDITSWPNKNNLDTTFYANGFTYPGAPAGCNLVSYTKDPITMEEFPTYLVLNNNGLRYLIEAGTFGGSEGALKAYTFTSTYGTKYKDSLENYFTMLLSDIGLNIPLADSIKIIYKININSEIDGFGTLKMDVGSFDVLRQKMTQTVTTTAKIRNTITGTYIDVPGGLDLGSGDFTSNSYTWMGQNSGQPYLTANEDTLGNITDMNYMVASSRGFSTSLKENKIVRQESKVYPVPAKDQITIETQTSKMVSATLKVYDILGNEVMPAKEVEVTSGLSQLPVNVTNLKPGVYFYTLSGNGMNTSNKFVVK